MTSTGYAHIELNKDGKPIISGTRTKVIQIAMEKIGWGWDADQIHRQYPYLTLGQIHSALAYYYDHKEELDRAIEESERLADEMRASLEESPARQKLRALGLIP
jgi:uncharacterized protein (DUF433 family)